MLYLFVGKGGWEVLRQKNLVLWSNFPSIANNPKKPWIRTTHVEEDGKQQQLLLCSLLIFTELHLSWHFGFSKPSLHTSLKSFIAMLREMSYMGLSFHQSSCHCMMLSQPFQGCPLQTPIIDPSIKTRKPHTGTEFNSLVESRFSQEIFVARMCREPALGFRCKAGSLTSRQVVLLSLARLLYINK